MLRFSYGEVSGSHILGVVLAAGRGPITERGKVGTEKEEHPSSCWEIFPWGTWWWLDYENEHLMSGV